MDGVINSYIGSTGSFERFATLLLVPVITGLWAWTRPIFAPGIVVAMFSGF